MTFQPNHKKIAIAVAVFLVALIVGNELLKYLNMSLKKTPPFEFKNVGTAEKKRRFYDWILPMAKFIGAKYGIPWQAIAVQSALETSWGASSLLSKYNNFGGIKDTDGINAVDKSTKEFINGHWITIQDGFEVWKTPFEGLEGYAKFIHNNPRYSKALNYPTDPFRYIEEIHKAGYATSPNYVSILHGQLKRDFG